MSTILKHFCLKLFAMKIETRIKELRLEKELTQSDLAKAISTSQRNIGRWENGENEPTASFLIENLKAVTDRREVRLCTVG